MQSKEFPGKKGKDIVVLAVTLWMVLAGTSYAQTQAQEEPGTAAPCEVTLLQMPIDMPKAKPAVRDVVIRFDTAQTSEHAEEMLLTIYCECEDTNHVGNEWRYGFSLNDEPLTSGSRAVVPADAGIHISAWIEEEDKYSDYGFALDTILITWESLQSGFSFTQTIAVTEDGGRYKGNCALWTVSYFFIAQK